MIETVKEKLKALKMKACAQHLDQVIETAARKNRPFLETLDHLLDLELEAKRKNRVARLFKESKLTEKLTIDQFEFSFHKSRQKQKMLILDLMQLEFIKQRKDIILIGNPGAGKTFLAKCMAYAATQAGIKTLFTTTMEMINHLMSAEADHSLLKKLHYSEITVNR